MDVGSGDRIAQYHRTYYLSSGGEAELLSMLIAEKLTKRYGSELAVDGVSFMLEEGTSTALIGPNGAGKTTTLSMLADLLKPTGGTVSWDAQSGIGFLPQQPRFFPWLTAIEFMEMAAKISGVGAKEARRQSEKTLQFVGLGTAMQKKTGAFSGGMKQRLGLAQAIVHQPKLLLLDEPVSALDPTGRREIMDLLKTLQQHTTILYSTHILNDAEEMTDQLLFMQAGKLVEQGSLAEVKKRYAEPYIRIRFKDAREASAFLQESRWKAEAAGASVIVPEGAGSPGMQEILGALASRAASVVGVERQSATLEEIFLKVVGAR